MNKPRIKNKTYLEAQDNAREIKFTCMIDLEGQFKKVWETTKFVLLIYTLLYLPLKVAFIEDFSLGLYLLDKLIDFVFLVDIILTFFTPIWVKNDMIF